MLPPILKSIKIQLVEKEDKRSCSENTLLDELIEVEQLMVRMRARSKVIRPLSDMTIMEEKRPAELTV